MLICPHREVSEYTFILPCEAYMHLKVVNPPPFLIFQYLLHIQGFAAQVKFQRVLSTEADGRRVESFWPGNWPVTEFLVLTTTVPRLVMM